MRRLLINRVAWILGAVLGTAGTMLAIQQDWVGFSDASSPERPIAFGSPGWLIEKHDCWTGEAPADMVGVLPGHVVLTYAGHPAPTYGGERAVGVALEQLAFDGVITGDGRDHGVIVHAFCR
jgi:hypothetical protein